MRADNFQHAGVVFIPPAQLVAGQQVGIDQCLVDWRPGEVFEAIIGALCTLDLSFLDQHQIFDADAIGAGLVIAGLVGEEHAGEEDFACPCLPTCRFGDTLWPFMDREESANAVAGAVRIIDAGLPQILPRQRIQLAACSAFREDRAGERDMALEHASVAILHLGSGLSRADPYGAGHIGGAIEILPAAIDQIDAARFDPSVRLFIDPVMRQGGIGPGG